MFNKITQITLDEIKKVPVRQTVEAEQREELTGALLGLGALFGPIAVLCIAMYFTNDLHISGALCFFAYAQLSHANAIRRCVRRKNALVELFYFDQRKSAPMISPYVLTQSLQEFVKWHRRASLSEIIFIPVGAVALALTEIAKIISPHSLLMQSLIFVAPVVLVSALAGMLISLKHFARLQSDAFDNKNNNPL